MVTNNLVKKSVGFSENKNEEVLVKADHVSKKFCRSLKKALWYGVQDIGSEIIGRKYDHKLRPDEFWAVNDISFEVKRGECLGLIGPNGAGKSTLLKMLNGLIKPDQGSIMMRGRISALIELTAGFNPILTGLENIYNRAAILGLSKAEVDRKLDDIVEFAEIADFLHTPVQSYSSGMKIRLGFAVAAQLEPDVLILDEVLAVGDVGFRAKCFNTIHKIMQNSAVIFVSHAMPQVSRICTNLLVMHHGKPVFLGNEIGKGIQIFYSYFKGEEQGIVVGSGKALLHQVNFRNQYQEVVESINYLDELSVELEFFIDPNVFNFGINLEIMSQELQLIAESSSIKNNCYFSNHNQTLKNKKLMVNLGKINFRPGWYSLSIRFESNHGGEVLARYYNYKKFRVQGKFISFAPIQIPGNWKKIY
ncbi:MAG: polysaccharide ABC transporter ATP-binding protein [Halothece sp.]